MTLANVSQIADVILLIQVELRKLGLWEVEAPNDASMRSTLPFACDKLSITQWLQWVFIPRVVYHVERDYAFPFAARIAPYAETMLVESAFDAKELIKLLHEFDRLAVTPSNLKN